MSSDVDVEVLIVGAGISGIGMACHLTTHLPGTSFAILEGRDAIGGTWDLFRYPGIRSDSDLHTFGYEFKPWTSPNAIAEAHEILDYLREATIEHGIERRIRLGHRVLRADWSSAEARWTVQVQRGDEQLELTSRFLFSATGYYDYAGGFRPRFEGEERFAGQIIHPQQWPEDLDYRGKRVVVIGSGATAVTLVPAMADEAAHVTMLQRSPGYVVSVPRRNPIANGLRRVLPDRTAYRLTRRMNIALWQGVYNASRRWPRGVRRLIRAQAKRQLPDACPVDVHFKPKYDPWDERLCAVPDGDLFRAIKAGKASVATDRIAEVTEGGLQLESGRELPADIVVTATGLNMLPFGGIDLHVDGEPVAVSDTVVFKSMMLSGVPNFAFALGYTNISWTLKVDLVCEHLCRLIGHMRAQGHDVVTPTLDDPAIERLPLFEFQAGYIQRGIPAFPRRGSHGPWTVEMSYAADYARLREGEVVDGALRFGGKVREVAEAAASA
ncbi:flavin-containing monooxygenase [Patulibacter defluvii]|uniref:flavin-containing monooxygenase n=1 Tax=Patulibacter defluvii TaxID=3095358 RepID=UPI002A74C574|nr:NAD(P)/FAD-dependent oxidoreductase [Patulibacter sp. DM4]